jgi:hypothetical protein
MSSLLRNAAVAALAISVMEAVAFGQHYNETDLVTNATDSALINPWGLSRGSSTP